METAELLQPENIAKAIESFTKKLPNAKNNSASTIVEDFKIKGKRITLRAQKSKSITGMKWDIVVC